MHLQNDGVLVLAQGSALPPSHTAVTGQATGRDLQKVVWSSMKDSSVLDGGVEFGGPAKDLPQLLLSDSLCYSAVLTEQGRLAVRMWDGPHALSRTFP